MNRRIVWTWRDGRPRTFTQIALGPIARTSKSRRRWCPSWVGACARTVAWRVPRSCEVMPISAFEREVLLCLAANRMELDSFDLITNLVALGMGVSFVPVRALALDGQKKRIQRMALKECFTRATPTITSVLSFSLSHIFRGVFLSVRDRRTPARPRRHRQWSLQFRFPGVTGSAAELSPENRGCPRPDFPSSVSPVSRPHAQSRNARCDIGVSGEICPTATQSVCSRHCSASIAAWLCCYSPKEGQKSSVRPQNRLNLTEALPANRALCC